MAKLKNYNGRYCESEYESAFIAFLESVGWHYLAGNQIPRSYSEVLIAEDFKAFIAKTSPGLLPEETEQPRVTLPPCTRCISGWWTAFSSHRRTVCPSWYR